MGLVFEKLIRSLPKDCSYFAISVFTQVIIIRHFILFFLPRMYCD